LVWPWQEGAGGKMLSPEWKEKLQRIREKLELFRGHL
jgi:hypothetical protein